MTITAKIVADSLSPAGIRLTTMELQFHRFILPEFNTHRMFSRNASSSRAIPIEKMIASVEASPAMPIHWGKNQAGMQAREECNKEVKVVEEYGDYYYNREDAWKEAAGCASDYATGFTEAGYHKQIVNRLLEPFQYIKVIVTATEWDNFFKLRLHKDAQPEMMELARCMKEAMDGSLPVTLSPGQWHLPYVSFDERSRITREVAIKCSVARCARVSYLNHDASVPDVAKDIALADMLLEAGHMSPFEHQATPMEETNGFIGDEILNPYVEWENGITHMDREADLWSGNFRGWIQNRNLI